MPFSSANRNATVMTRVPLIPSLVEAVAVNVSGMSSRPSQRVNLSLASPVPSRSNKDASAAPERRPTDAEATEATHGVDATRRRHGSSENSLR
jgi:hypothetical protein